MAGNITLRSYLDLDNGALENTVNYSNDAITQDYSSLRRFTKRVGGVMENAVGGTQLTIGSDADHPENGIVFKLTMPKLGADVEIALGKRIIANANDGAIMEDADNALVYHRGAEWTKYILEYGPDLKNPRYVAFYNLDEQPIYICKSAEVDTLVKVGDVPTDGGNTYTLIPFLTVLPGTSVGPVIFNPHYGNLFVVSATTGSDQDLYVVVYNG